VWNSRDSSSGIVEENAEICQKYCLHFNGFSDGIEETPEIYKQFFSDGKYEYQAFQNNLEYDLDNFIGRNLSTSYTLKITDENYMKFIDELKKLFTKYSKNNKLVVPHITRSYIGNV
jgi:hypothetical protein